MGVFPGLYETGLNFRVGKKGAPSPMFLIENYKLLLNLWFNITAKGWQVGMKAVNYPTF